MTAEDRIASLHARMDALREKRERRKTAALGLGCGSLTACLILLIGNVGTGGSGGGPAPGGTAGLYSGAAILFENAGVYVLLAVAAFMVGVVVTALCIRYRKKRESEWNDGRKEREPR